MDTPVAMRFVPRDGAALFFDPASGTNLLVRGEGTRALRARAPRTVMFGLTNRCNLRCSFCSRDTNAASRWTDDDVVHLARELAERGVLELALGGGEPLTFRGLDALLARLRDETPLAVHLTTNGVLLDEARLATLRPLVGEIRLSLYEETPWPARVAALTRAEGSFGVNLLVTRDRVTALPELLARLEGLGCPDVALLRYVGPEPELALSPSDEARVAEAAMRTAMRVRASVCFGDRLALPTLRVDTSDCGAGRDFVVIGTDRTVRGCSFGRGGVPFTTADELLEVWRCAHLDRAVELEGCARREGLATGESADGVFAWQAFSGNNSGDCFLVGKFERGADASAFLDRVRRDGPGLGEGEVMAQELVAIGRSVIGWTASAPADDFPSLRAGVWRAGGRIVANGVHEHDEVSLVTAVHDERARLEALETRAAVAELGRHVLRGDVLFGCHTLARHGLAHAIDRWRTLAGPTAVIAAELHAENGAGATLARTVARRPPEGEREWLVGGAASDRAADIVADHVGHAAAGGSLVVIDRPNVRPHDGARASRGGSRFAVVAGETVRLRLSLFHEGWRTPIDGLELLERELRAELGADAHLESFEPESRVHVVRASLVTREPLRIVPFLAEFAAGRGLRAWLRLEALDPLHALVGRLDVDVRALVRERRGR